MNLITRPLKTVLWQLVLLLVLTISCNDDDEPQIRQVNLTVQNEAGMALEASKVTLYATKADWEQEQNSIKSELTTDADGLVEFIDLEPGSYYIDIEKDAATNWSTQTTITQPEAFGMTDLIIKIGVSQLDLLTGKVGKEYAYTDLQIEGISLFEEVDACEQDNSSLFLREGLTGMENANVLRCTSNQPDSRTFNWSLSASGDMLSINYTDGESLEYTVTMLDESNLIISAPIDLEGQTYSADFHFDVK